MRVYCSILAAVVIAATGCASSEYAKRPPLTGDAIIDGKNNIQFGPKKDRVLWEYRVALAAMRRGDYAEAKQQRHCAHRRHLQHGRRREESARLVSQRSEEDVHRRAV
jgi:hypothetical protein